MENRSCISALEHHSRISRALSAEGIVLLENNGILPIKKSGTVALYGNGAFQTRASAGGMFGPPAVGPDGPAGPGSAPNAPPPGFGHIPKKLPSFHSNLSDALSAAGYTLLTDEQGTQLSDEVPGYVLYVLRRDSAEGADRKCIPGDYLLMETEKETLHTLARTYGNVILVLNVCAVTDFYSTYTAINEEIPGGIGAVLLIGLGGEGNGDAAVSVLRGDITPSGKLTDTWALRYEDYPSAATFGEAGHTNFQSFGDNEYFFEGIYNGYRYFDTFNMEVAYPFGFGRSYTDFTMKTESVTLKEDASAVALSASVTNTGSVSGKEVVQVYTSFRDTRGTAKLETPYQVLSGYQKTRELAPGETELVEITFPISSMASYDEESDCFLLQAGEYFLRVGNSSRNTSVAAVLTLDETVTTEICTKGLFEIKNDERLPGDDAEVLKNGLLTHKDIQNPELSFKCWDKKTDFLLTIPAEILKKKVVDSRSSFDSTTVTTLVSRDPATDSHAWKNRTSPNHTGKKEVYQEVDTLPGATLADVDSGRITMAQFVAGLSVIELTDLVTGLSSEQTAHLFDPDSPLLSVCREGVSSYQGTKHLITSRLIPQVYQADGPESPGITLGFDEIWAGATDNSATTDAYSAVILPSGTVMAQSWNPDLVREMGVAVGEEMLSAGLSIWLAPGANIHRNPLGGRNYQYYSEDPVITGTMLTAEVSGVQSQGGVFCCAKHFAANGMETNRGEVNEVMTERTLREIYLPGWRMCAQSEYPNASFMSAYNQINGTYCGENYDLLTHLIRGEWKWGGFVMDDYTPWFFLCWRDLTICPQVGNDLVMPGNTSNNLMPVPFIPLENPVNDMEFEGVTAPFQSDTYLMHIALRDGKLLLGDLQRSAAAILHVYRKTKAFEELKFAANDTK
ncbi:MAG: glycoside hydrolase family 3 N-terminal domain-containing protein [Oscillospiraceae bacterium]|nr:glycoside hydrolase family 3 N-terminal domain-containing protein [Oscillospiraceae bacterium]